MRPEPPFINFINKDYDCHCHILPGLDDGARNLEESLFLAGWLASHGCREAVCTSHSTRLYQNTAEIVEAAVESLQSELDAHGIALTLIPSLEYRLVPEVWPHARLLPWKGNHLLIELPLKKPEKMGPLVPEEEIRKLIGNGYQPVLAHPERYLWSTTDDYRRWHDAGAAFQLNLGAMEGFYGGPVQNRAQWLRENGFYSFLGSDLHNVQYAEAFDQLAASNGSGATLPPYSFYNP